MLGLRAFDSVFQPVLAVDEATEAHDAWLVLLDWLTPGHSGELPVNILNAVHYSNRFEHELLETYQNLIRQHFLALITPILQQKSKGLGVEQLALALGEAKAICSAPLRSLEAAGVAVHQFQGCVDRPCNAIVRLQISFSELERMFGTYFESRPIHKCDARSVQLVQALMQCGLADRVCKIIANSTILEIKRTCRSMYSKVHEASVVAPFKAWALEHLIPSINRLLGDYFHTMELDNGKTDTTTSQILILVEEALCELRTEELFDIVVNFPNSAAALADLRACLKEPWQRAAVVNTFQRSCVQRLLQGGTNTVGIISTYISVIRAFSTLDPKGVLLEKVARPIRRYLKDREDTISILVSGFLGDESSDIKFLSLELNDDADEVKPVGDEENFGLDWEPDPIDAPGDFTKDSSLDIVATLLSLYENKEVFVREFANVFADRMLSNVTAVDEIQVFLELLKARFGDRELQNLDVMVRDMVDSRQIDGAVHGLSSNSDDASRQVLSQLHATILSRLFWPPFKKQEFTLPRDVEQQLEAFSSIFSEIKPNRKLKWLPNLGTVTVELDFEDRTLTIDVSPDKAAAIALFDGESRSVGDVASALSISPQAAIQILQFWAARGVLSADGDLYSPVEVLSESEEVRIHNDEESASSAVPSAEERASDEMKMYWTYITAMLTNVGAIPLERIHSFLKMVVPSDIAYTRSQNELERYLMLKVEEEELDFTDGTFKLRG